jgi:predicted amidohydrolase YtcJ
VIFENGTFVTHPDADVLVVRGDRIAAVGPVASIPEDLLGDLDRFDLNGRALLPGFIDAHVHIFGTGLVESGWRIQLQDLTREEACETIADEVKARGAGEWVLSGGWDESRWADRRYLTRADLDRLSPNSPVGSVRMDGHLLILNSEGFRAVREILELPEHRALVDEKTGQVREEAAWKVIESLEPDEATLSDALSAAARYCHRLGVTSVHAMTTRTRVPILLRARGRDRLRVTAFQKVASANDVSEIREDDAFDEAWTSFGGVKAFADGSLGAGNAAVGTPYVDGGAGELNHSDEDLRAILRAAEDAGWRTAIHAIGDRAIAQVLACHVEVESTPELRHRIEHFELPAPGQIDAVCELGLYLSMQPNFTGNWSGPDSMYERKLGVERDRGSNPIRSVLDAGAPLAFGSDGMPLSPLYGMHSAVNAPYPSQQISVDEAIEAYTAGGAEFAFEEGSKGCLEVGAFADLVILDEDPRCAPDAIVDRQVLATYVGGECVFRAEEGKR